MLIVLAVLLLSTPAYADDIVYRAAITDKKQIALTFDDGPHPGRTPEILDILERYNIKATFFLIGENVEYYPDIVKREIASGHEVGNHTYSHATLNQLTEVEIEEEILKFENALFKLTDYPLYLIRPPCGVLGENLKSTVGKSNYKIILWSIDTRDWAHTSVDDICNNIISNAKSGDIILMHDYITGTSPTPKVLEKIIPILLEDGFEFVTVSELLN